MHAGPRLVSAQNLANSLGISVRTLWRLRNGGKLPRPVQLGRSLRWRADEIEKWIKLGCPPLPQWEANGS
jgi:predicted DNA-binding transcriptional regulator AlpA